MNARYPNLELLEYKARVALSSDEEFLKTIEEQDHRRGDRRSYVYEGERWSDCKFNQRIL